MQERGNNIYVYLKFQQVTCNELFCYLYTFKKTFLNKYRYILVPENASNNGAYLPLIAIHWRPWRDFSIIK